MSLLIISRNLLHCSKSNVPTFSILENRTRPMRIEKMEKKPLLLTNRSNIKLCTALLLLSISTTALFLGLRDKTRILANMQVVVVAPDPCYGRYIYIQNPPSRFNQDLVRRCETVFTSGPNRDMCPYLDNDGLGRRLVESDDPEGALSNGSWYLTNWYSLSVIFHSRMLNYECLTNDSSLASAVYVPYYPGLDASRYMWSRNLSLRDESAVEFEKWVAETREWKRMWGRDHFIVTGRTAWDFRRQLEEESAWGSRLRLLPHSYNMSMLSVESGLWSNDYAIPYPTCFHPSRDGQLLQWQQRMRTRARRYLFSFVGAPRARNPKTLRAKVIDECRGSTGLCKLLGCGGTVDCDNPARVMGLLQESVFCLQPRGDSYTRRSFFDSIVAGCIPVLFHPGSAYVQYQWHLPKDHHKYSVYIPVENEADWWPGIVNRTLLNIPQDRVKAMREEVIRLIPEVVYAHPAAKLNNYEDAFDLAVKGILDRIHTVRSIIEQGMDPSVSFAESNVSKFVLSMYQIGH